MLVLTAIVALGLPGVAHAETFSCGMVAHHDVTLTQDESCQGQTAITVKGTKVTIDLGGHTLSSDRTVNTYGVIDKKRDGRLTVKNGTISGFDEGINASVESLTVDGVTFDNHVRQGIAYDGMKVVISDVVVHGSNLEAINIVSRRDGTVKVIDSEVSHNLQFGLDVAGGAITVSNLTATDNQYGASFGNARSLNLSNSSLSSNSGQGVRIENVDHVKVITSEISDNGDDGLWATRNGRTRIGARPDTDGSEANTANDNGALGINVHDQRTKPHGLNHASGNTDPAQCEPVSLCSG